jgi:hypothetical protein
VREIRDEIDRGSSDASSGLVAQRGVRDAPSLSEMTLKELKHYLPFA